MSTTTISRLCLLFLSHLTIYAKSEDVVKSIKINELYKRPDCNTSVSCFVEAEGDDPSAVNIDIQFVRGPTGYQTIQEIPGISLGKVERSDIGVFKRTLAIRKCYENIRLMCKTTNSSSKYLDLSPRCTSDEHCTHVKRGSCYSGLCKSRRPFPVTTVTGIGVWIGMFIIGAIGYAIKHRKAGAVGAGGVVQENISLTDIAKPTTSNISLSKASAISIKEKKSILE